MAAPLDETRDVRVFQVKDFTQLKKFGPADRKEGDLVFVRADNEWYQFRIPASAPTPDGHTIVQPLDGTGFFYRCGPLGFEEPVVSESVLNPVALTSTRGQRWLIKGIGAGGWLTKDNAIAEYQSGAVTLAASWIFIPASAGMQVASLATGNEYVFNGVNWVDGAPATAILDGDFAGTYAAQLRRTAAGAYMALKDNLVAVVAPGPNDDSGASYGAGSRWIDTVLNTAWVCTDPAPAAAIWVRDDAYSAQQAADAAQADATQGIADAAAAQGDATQALADAATADGKAVAAQADATQALADAATADGKAVAAQADATQALADAATADGKAVAAQADATQGIADAAAAQADATQAIADAAAAQADATAAQADATSALAKAIQKVTKQTSLAGLGASPVNIAFAAALPANAVPLFATLLVTTKATVGGGGTYVKVGVGGDAGMGNPGLNTVMGQMNVESGQGYPNGTRLRGSNGTLLDWVPAETPQINVEYDGAAPTAGDVTAELYYVVLP